MNAQENGEEDPMHENSVEGDEELGNDCAILKKMQTTIRTWATPFSYIRLRKSSSYNHLSRILPRDIIHYLANSWVECLGPCRSQNKGLWLRIRFFFPSKILLFFDKEIEKILDFFFQF
jgi:hypothetical protein